MKAFAGFLVLGGAILVFLSWSAVVWGWPQVGFEGMVYAALWRLAGAVAVAIGGLTFVLSHFARSGKGSHGAKR